MCPAKRYATSASQMESGVPIAVRTAIDPVGPLTPPGRLNPLAAAKLWFYYSMPWIGPTPDDLSVSGFSP